MDRFQVTNLHLKDIFYIFAKQICPYQIILQEVSLPKFETSLAPPSPNVRGFFIFQCYPYIFLLSLMYFSGIIRLKLIHSRYV